MSDKIPVIHIDNIRGKIENLDTGMAGILCKKFEIPVPNYWFSPRFKSGQWDGRQKFFLRPANTFPTGLLPMVIETFQEEDIEYILDDTREQLEEYRLNPVSKNYTVTDTKESREYQIDTINKVIQNQIEGKPFMRGVINIATNGGKTTIAEAIIKELYPKLQNTNKRMLFVTHSKEIALQSKKSFETDLGIKVGFIGNGKWELDTVNIALVPTLYKRVKTPEFKNLVTETIGFIADEVHHSSSNSWYEVLQKFKNASIRLGLTGTVDKDNKINEYRLYSCTGTIINKISNEYLIQHGYSAKPICILFKISSPELEGEIYSEAYQLGIVESEERLQTIYEICKKETDSNNNVLILVEHIDHGQYIEECLNKLENKKVVFTNGQLDTDSRTDALDNLRGGKTDVLISTAILDEGVDVSNINAVIYARGMKSTRKLLQGIGRGLRKKADGSKLRFYDFIDDTHTSLLLHSQNRYKILKSEGFTVKMYDIEKYKEMNLEEIDDE